MEKEKRRRQSLVGITGIGVVIFGFWSFIKINLYFLLGRDHLISSSEFLNESDPMEALKAAYIILLVVAIIDLLLRIYIGKNAIFEAKNYHRRSHYIGVAIMLILFSLLNLFTAIISIDLTSEDLPDQFASFIVELTSLSMLIELVKSTWKLRELRNEKKAVRRK